MKEIPNWLLCLLCGIILVSGVSAILLPHPTSWGINLECEFIEGRITKKEILEKECLFDMCVGDPTFTLDNETTVHVSPNTYYTKSNGSLYSWYVC